MTAEDQAATNPDTANESAAKRGPDPIRRITRIVLLAGAVYLGFYIAGDRLTPYTDQARIQALVTPIVPRVAGHLTAVDIRLHSVVENGDRMFQIDPRPFRFAVLTAEANLDLAAQHVGAQTATVKSATARLGVARAQLDRAQRNYSRTKNIVEYNPGALSQADRDRAETGLDQALERVTSSEAELQRAREQLGAEGPDNPQLRVAVAALEQAQFDLAFTDIIAPDHGIVESFNVSVGFYAQPGQALATFVSQRGQWIQADMKENNIGNIEVGDPVEFVLDVAPGKIFKGKVQSVGTGVSAGGPTNRGELPTVSSSSGWLRDPQRFPVIIAIESDGARKFLRPGGQVDVVVYSGHNVLLNALGKLKIRLSSVISYVR
jgi:multidrug resistance efflux pump